MCSEASAGSALRWGTLNFLERQSREERSPALPGLAITSCERRNCLYKSDKRSLPSKPEIIIHFNRHLSGHLQDGVQNPVGLFSPLMIGR